MSDSHTLREINLRPIIADEEWAIKISTAQKWLDAGHDVAVSVHFRGRESAHWERALPLLARFAEELSTVAAIADAPKYDRPRLTMRLVPK